MKIVTEFGSGCSDIRLHIANWHLNAAIWTQTPWTLPLQTKLELQNLLYAIMPNATEAKCRSLLTPDWRLLSSRPAAIAHVIRSDWASKSANARRAVRSRCAERGWQKSRAAKRMRSSGGNFGTTGVSHRFSDAVLFCPLWAEFS